MKTIDAEAVETSTGIVTLSTASLAKVEIDSAISTAKQYPRDEEQSLAKAMKLVKIAGQRTDAGLFYKLPRGGKEIEGPSVRLAEIIAKTYGNCRFGARVVAEEDNFVIAQGVFHDLETNTALTIEVKRRIRDRNGVRYNDDMISTTSNAAAGIAYRNAVLKGIPKVLWQPLYDEARKLAGGSTKKETEKKKVELTEILHGSGITPKMISAKFGVKDLKQLTPAQVADLAGIATAIKDGEITAARAFDIPEKREKSGVKSKSANADDHITLDQQRDIMSLIQDKGYKTSEIAGPLKAIGHKGALNELKQGKLNELIHEIEKLKSRNTERLF